MTSKESLKAKQIPGDGDLLCARAEVFRSKLIQEFNLLDCINELGNKADVAKYYTSDIIDDEKSRTMLLDAPHALLRFQVYSSKISKEYILDRRHTRLKNRLSHRPPFDLWAHWVVESQAFQNFILTLILLNGIILGIEAEINDKVGREFETMRLILKSFDYCTLMVFVAEIVLKWCDDFWPFWKNRWNVFDFLITFLSVVPEIITHAAGSNLAGASQIAHIADTLRTFRIFRTLKVVSRFRKVKLIVLAVTKAFQDMVFISILTFIFLYIFALTGVIFFSKGYKNPPPGVELYYANSFRDIQNALITVFQLFTLDHWYVIYQDVAQVAPSSLFGGMYIVLWILIGSFIFRNIFVGIMVNNFQNIRNDLFVEVQEIQDQEQRDKQMAEFAEELDRQKSIRQISLDKSKKESVEQLLTENFGNELGASASKFKSVHELHEAISQHLTQTTHDSTEWQQMVERNIHNLALEETHFCWPRDSLFQYLLMMESLMENLFERQELMRLASDALLQIADS